MSAGDWKSFYQAAVDGDLALVRHHITEGVDPNYQHPEVLRTALVTSLVAGHGEVARYLLAHGADPSLVSGLDGLTPLQAARTMGTRSSPRYCASLAPARYGSPSGGAGFRCSPYDDDRQP